MVSVSALTFCYNEADKIENCLTALKGHVDEIIIYDLESTDGTGDIARKFTDKVFTVPYLACGDSYKLELFNKSQCDWVFWFYPDEVMSWHAASSLKVIPSIHEECNAFCFMRREFMDGVRIAYNDKDGKNIKFGTAESPNYQIRLFKKDPMFSYTELVHAEYHVIGPEECKIHHLPEEYYMEHRKTSKDQELDNIRLYLWYNYLLFKYGDTQVEPYKRYMDSYRKIITDSEVKNLTGERKISLMEEFWWDWRSYSDRPRITLEEFKKEIGITYEEFLSKKGRKLEGRIMVGYNVKDKILDGILEAV